MRGPCGLRLRSAFIFCLMSALYSSSRLLHGDDYVAGAGSSARKPYHSEEHPNRISRTASNAIRVDCDRSSGCSKCCSCGLRPWPHNAPGCSKCRVFGLRPWTHDAPGCFKFCLCGLRPWLHGGSRWLTFRTALLRALLRCSSTSSNVRSSVIVLQDPRSIPRVSGSSNA